MLRSITWAEYCTAIIILAIIYYTYVVLVYYRAETVMRFSKAKSTVTQPEPSTMLVPICNELEAYCEQAARQQSSKEDILHAFHSVLRKYDASLVESNKRELVQLMRFYSKNICAVSISEEELVGHVLVE